MPTRSTGKASPSNQSKPAAEAETIKSFVRRILLASPDFPRLYADTVISSAPNSNEARILRDNYQKIAGMNMPVHPNVKTCTHIKVTGIRCGSPALRGEQFCYFHQRMVRGVRTPPQSRLHPVALIEDEEALQASLMEIINALARNTIDLHRAELILRALHIAVKNIRRVRFDFDADSMIKEVPNYPASAKNDNTSNNAGKNNADKNNAETSATSAHVETAAPGCPGGADVSRRGSSAPASEKKPSASVKQQTKNSPRAAPSERPKPNQIKVLAKNRGEGG